MTPAPEALRQNFDAVSIREQFGRSMVVLAGEYPQLVALTADLMYATGMAGFSERYPDRLVNVGIAEQNMTGMAAGLAACGKLPVVCGYAAFTSLRALEQAKVDAAYNQLKVLLVGQSAGLSYGVGGPTHQTYEDLAIMRAIPNMRVVVPADAPALDQALRACIEDTHPGPIYIRLGRGPEYRLPAEAPPLQLGRARLLRDGGDVCIIACGAMVFESVLAATCLAAEGISCSVLDLHTVKPLDVAALQEQAGRVRGFVVAEEHSVIGGLGAAVLEALAGRRNTAVQQVGIQDCFPPVGPPHELRAHLGLDAAGIMKAVRTVLKPEREEPLA